MPSLRTLVVVLAATSSFTCARASHLREREVQKPTHEDFFDSVNGGRLHEALQDLHPAFRNGVYENDRPALEAVHAGDPSLASKLVSIAKVELAKRQNVSSTSSADVVTSTSTVVVVSSTSTPSSVVVVPPTTEVTSSSSSSVVVETSTSPIILTGSTTTVTSSVVVISTSSPEASTSSLVGQSSSSVAQPSTSVTQLSSSEPQPSSPEGQTSTAITTVVSTSQVRSTAPLPSSTPGSIIPATSSTFTPQSTVVIGASATPPSSAEIVIIPQQQTTINSVGSTIVTLGALTALATASVQAPITTTNSRGQTVTASTLVPAIVFSATDARGSTFLTTSAVPTVISSAAVISTTDQFGHSLVLSVSGLSSGAVITTTDAAGLTITTTYHPSGLVVESLVLETTVLPNGQQQIITRTAIVIPTPADGAASDNSAGGLATGITRTTNPSLQTAAANPPGRVSYELAAMVGGIIGAACLL